MIAIKGPGDIIVPPKPKPGANREVQFENGKFIAPNGETSSINSVDNGKYNLLSDSTNGLPIKLNIDIATIGETNSIPPRNINAITQATFDIGTTRVFLFPDGKVFLGSNIPGFKSALRPVEPGQIIEIAPGLNIEGTKGGFHIATPEYDITLGASNGSINTIDVQTGKNGVDNGQRPDGFFGASLLSPKGNFPIPLGQFQVFEDGTPGPIPSPDDKIPLGDLLTAIKRANKDGKDGVTQKELQDFINAPHIDSLKEGLIVKAAQYLLTNFDTIASADGAKGVITLQDARSVSARDLGSSTGDIKSLSTVDLKDQDSQNREFPVKVLKETLQQAAGKDGKLTGKELDAYIQKSEKQLVSIENNLEQLEERLQNPGLPQSLRDSLTKQFQNLTQVLKDIENHLAAAHLLKDNFSLFSSNGRFGNPPIIPELDGGPRARDLEPFINLSDIDRVAGNANPPNSVSQEDLDIERQNLLSTV